MAAGERASVRPMKFVMKPFLLDPPGELAPADELVPSEPLAASVFVDRERLATIPEIVRTVGGDLTLTQIRAAIARLEADRVPPNSDGTYHVHVTSVTGALVSAAWSVRGVRTWAAARRAIARRWARRRGPDDDLAAVAARATDDERAQALQRIRREIWKPVARRRRQDRKARRGWA